MQETLTRLGVEDVESLRDRFLPLDTPATRLPTDAAGILSPRLAAQVADWRDRLRGVPGFAVVDTGTGALGDDDVATVAWNAFTQLCLPVPQYDTGELIHAVEVKPETGKASPYSTSDAHGRYHTDGSMLSPTPGVVMLYCLTPSDTGGETVLIDIEAAVRQLDSASVQTLRREHPCAFDADSEVRWQPVLADGPDGGLLIRYVRWYVEQGYQNLDRPLPDDVRVALDALDAFAEEERHQTTVPLARGEMLVFDNHRFLHGRRPFPTTGAPRRLRRVYGCLR